jgi:hypothetical protein
VFWGELSDLKEVKNERPDLPQDAVQRGLVQEHGEYGARAPLLRRGARNADSTVPPRCPSIRIMYKAVPSP